MSVNIVNNCREYTFPVKVVPWSTGTYGEIAAIISALDKGTITIEDTSWVVGDTRTVELTNGETTEWVIMDSTLQGMTPADPSKPLHFAVGMKNSMATAHKMNSGGNAGGWDQCEMRTYVNNDVANLIPSDFRNLFRQFKWKLGQGGGVTSGLIESTDLFALPNEMQIFGKRTFSQDDEAELYNHWQWYQTTANRKKKRGTKVENWWESSPTKATSYEYCGVPSDGGAFTSTAGSAGGVSPFGCI